MKIYNWRVGNLWVDLAVITANFAKVPVEEVCYFQATDKYTSVVTRDAELLIRADRIWRTIQGMLRITYGRAPTEKLSEAATAALT